MTRRKASMLLEINFILLLAIILFSGFSHGMISLWKNINSVHDQIYMGRVSRDLLAILEFQLTFHTQVAKIQNVEGRCVLHCSCLGGAKEKSFFCKKYPKVNAYGFYQSVQTKGKTPGINPLSPPDMGVTSFQVQRLSKRMLKVDFTLTVLGTGRHKAYTGILYLRNGVML